MRLLKLRTRWLKDEDRKMNLFFFNIFILFQIFSFLSKFSFFSEAIFTDDLVQKSYWIKKDELRCSQLLCKIPKSAKLFSTADEDHGQLYKIDAVF